MGSSEHLVIIEALERGDAVATADAVRLHIESLIAFSRTHLGSGE